MSKKFNPLVSIIIPVYNGSNFMCEAIDSAIAQTYNNIEIIVVNDGSTDDTEEIAKSYGDKIHYYSKENSGVATALNFAIKKSKGKYISWLSHDDVYYPNKIEKQIRRLNELSEGRRLNTILWSNFDLIDENNEILSKLRYQDLHSIDNLHHPLYPLLNGLIHGCTLLIPRQSFNDVEYFDESLKATQDYDLWVKIFPKYDIVFMEASLIKSRTHKSQNSKTIIERQKELDKWWINTLEGISELDMIDMSGTICDFYTDTHGYVKKYKKSYIAQTYLEDVIKKINVAGQG